MRSGGIEERPGVDEKPELLSSEQQFQRLVAGVTDCAIYMLDPRGYIVTWNPGAQRIKGYTAKEIVGQHFSRFYVEEDRAAGVPARMLAIAAREGKCETEAWRLRKDGARFWANVLIDAIYDPNGKLIGFAKITRDMTERRAMQEQLHQSQKMEAIGQLTGGIAHDFNNLLTVILGNLETIERCVSGGEERLRRAVDHATQGARGAAALTQQLLVFARRQPLNPRATDVNQLVSGMHGLIRRALNEEIVIESLLGDGLWQVDVDPHQLESALLNLTVNARDAMSAGGTLAIETANTSLSEEYASRLQLPAGQYVVISVVDTGVGMSREVISRACEPFFTTKPLGQGTGLGLSQVFGFVKQSKGHMNLYSEVGRGTSVKIYLPRLLDVQMSGEPAEPISAPRGRADETILIVEDDPAVRSIGADSLKELGYCVLEAHDGSSAMHLLQHHPEIKLLFTDFGLPDLNGRQLAQAAQRLRPGLKVLFTSAYARNAVIHRDRIDPGAQWLAKPFTRVQLATLIRNTLDMTPAPHEDQSIALIVSDEPLGQELLADTLEQAGLRVIETASAREALAMIERVGQIDVAFIDIGLPVRSALELAAEFRLRCRRVHVMVANSHAGKEAGLAKGTVVLTKPFDAAAVRATLDRLRLESLED